MRRIDARYAVTSRTLFCASVAVLIGAAIVSTSARAADRLVRLETPPDVAKSLAAIPRIAAPADAAERKINAAVARLDATARKAAAECGTGGKSGWWERSVHVPMQGPRYISYVIIDNSYCGGAHPNVGTMAIVYDLATGRPIDWKALLPSSLTGKLELATGMDGTRMIALSGRKLFDLYLQQYRPAAAGQKTDADADCRDAVSTAGYDGKPPGMMAWLDAKAAALVVSLDLAHAVQACADDGTISVSILKAAGAKPVLTDALEAAHRAVPPKPSAKP